MAGSQRVPGYVIRSYGSMLDNARPRGNNYGGGVIQMCHRSKNGGWRETAEEAGISDFTECGTKG